MAVVRAKNEHTPNMKFTLIVFILILSFSSYAVNKNDISTDAVKSKESINIIEKRPWWLGDVLTVLGIFTGVGIILFQLNRQHKNSIEAQKENYREQLRLEIYKEFYTCLENANTKTLKADMYAFQIKYNMENYIRQIELAQNPLSIEARAKIFSDLHFTSNHSVVDLIKLIEKHEIVSPELEVFKLAFNSASYNLAAAFNPLFSFLSGILPMDAINANGNPFIMNTLTPTEPQMTELNALLDTYKSSHDELSDYLYDLNIELQKIFLSRLFSNKVKLREPIDPNVKVITIESPEVEQLKTYFNENTPWGIHVNDVDREVRNSFQQP